MITGNSANMKTIYKYDIILKGLKLDVASIEMPQRAKILYIDCQSTDVISLWAEVETSNKKINRNFRIVGTGQRIADAHLKEYIGTVLDRNCVWHVYEID